MRWAFAAAGLAAITLTACSGADGAATPPGTSGSGTATGGGSTVTPEESRDLVVGALADTDRQLTRLGATVTATGAYADCADQGGSVQYIADARLDPAATSADFGAALAPGLAAAGWVLDPEPTAAPSGTSTRRGLKRDLSVRLTSYQDEPFALLQILGPCLDVGDRDAGYTGRGAEKLPPGR